MKSGDLQAVILVGGRGTRLRALYSDRPKALVPVAGRPFLEWQLDWLDRGGVRSIHLAAGFMSQVLRAWAESVKRPGLTLTFSEELAPLGTGGGLKFAASHIRGDPFLVLNGDSLMPNLDLPDFTASAVPNAAATLAVTSIEESGRYGTVEFDERGRVTAFREKAARDGGLVRHSPDLPACNAVRGALRSTAGRSESQDDGGWINGGVYLMAQRALAAMPADKAFSLERDFFPTLVEQKTLYARKVKPPLLDMGTPEGLDAMNRFLWPEKQS